MAGHVQGSRGGLGVSGSSPGDCPHPRFLLQSPARRLEGNTVCLFFVFTLSNPTETHSHSGEQETCCASPLSHLGGSGLKNLTQNFNGPSSGNDTLAARQVLMLLGASEDGRGVAIQEAADVASSHTTTRWGRRLASGFLQLLRRERGERVRVATSAALSLKQPSHVLSLRCCTRVHHSQRRSDDELFAVEEG